MIWSEYLDACVEGACRFVTIMNARGLSRIPKRSQFWILTWAFMFSLFSPLFLVHLILLFVDIECLGCYISVRYSHITRNSSSGVPNVFCAINVLLLYRKLISMSFLLSRIALGPPTHCIVSVRFCVDILHFLHQLHYGSL
ncbi:hypothetical protein M426DRAFT_238348 [Hypoxylon sp. CI-4A]|nr:hypothetical protein M426DRAFT_238348 [Hypoxylon sp. CI-4A]